jgi:hypothetical protein
LCWWWWWFRWGFVEDYRGWVFWTSFQCILSLSLLLLYFYFSFLLTVFFLKSLIWLCVDVYSGGGGVDCGAGFVYVGSHNCAWHLSLYSSWFWWQ